MPTRVCLCRVHVCYVVVLSKQTLYGVWDMIMIRKQGADVKNIPCYQLSPKKRKRASCLNLSVYQLTNGDGFHRRDAVRNTINNNLKRTIDKQMSYNLQKLRHFLPKRKKNNEMDAYCVFEYSETKEIRTKQGWVRCGWDCGNWLLRNRRWPVIAIYLNDSSRDRTTTVKQTWVTLTITTVTITNT